MINVQVRSVPPSINSRCRTALPCVTIRRMTMIASALPVGEMVLAGEIMFQPGQLYYTNQ